METTRTTTKVKKTRAKHKEKENVIATVSATIDDVPSPSELVQEIEHDKHVAEQHITKAEEEIQEMAERSKLQIELSKEKACKTADTHKNILKQQNEIKLRAELEAADIFAQKAKERLEGRQHELEHELDLLAIERNSVDTEAENRKKNAFVTYSAADIEKRVENLKDEIIKNADQAKLEVEEAVRESVRTEERLKRIMQDLAKKVDELHLSDKLLSQNTTTTVSATETTTPASFSATPTSHVYHRGGMYATEQSETSSAASAHGTSFVDKRPEDKPWTESLKEVFTGPSVPSDKLREVRHKHEEVPITGKIKEFLTGTPATPEPKSP